MSLRSARVAAISTAIAALVSMTAGGAATSATAGIRPGSPVDALSPIPALSPEQEQISPRPGDVATLDGIIRAYYEVVSGPAGVPRQVERDRSLHWPGVKVAMTGKGPDGEPFVRSMTLAEYHQGSEDPASGFWESEIHRVTQRFGQIVHVWSTYEWRSEEEGPVQGRGINSIQLYHDGERWWVMTWIYDSERPDNPIPPEYLPPAGTR